MSKDDKYDLTDKKCIEVLSLLQEELTATCKVKTKCCIHKTTKSPPVMKINANDSLMMELN